MYLFSGRTNCPPTVPRAFGLVPPTWKGDWPICLCSDKIKKFNTSHRIEKHNSSKPPVIGLFIPNRQLPPTSRSVCNTGSG